MLATALRTPFAPGVPPSRRARWGAVAIDILVGAGLAAGALAGGTAWLLVRTEAGTRDVPSGDAAFAFALLLSAVPAWLTLLAFSLATRGATPGQRSRHLEVQGAPWRRVVRLAVHPLGAAGWLWLAVVAMIAILPTLALLFASLGVTVLAGGVLSSLLALRRGEPGVHDRVASTRLIRAHPREAP
ncbi:MAG: RDD family protein [Dehalococcoidia bacterium]|nr:RDD family protein [Dehalococcoidia bacterium]